MIIVIPYQNVKSEILYDKAIKAGYKPIKKYLESDIHYHSEYCTFLERSEFGTLYENARLLHPFTLGKDVKVALDRVDPDKNWVTLLPEDAVSCVMDFYSRSTICMLADENLREQFMKQKYNVICTSLKDNRIDDGLRRLCS